MSNKEDKKGSDSALSAAAKRLGEAGGSKGGRARAESLSPEERSEIARQGGLAKAAKAKQAIHKAKKRRKK